MMKTDSFFPLRTAIFPQPERLKGSSWLHVDWGYILEKELPMPSQILTLPTIFSNFVIAIPSSYPTHNESIMASSLDYGFDFDEDELAKELLAPLPASLGNQTDHHVEPDEFNMLYRWFDA